MIEYNNKSFLFLGDKGPEFKYFQLLLECGICSRTHTRSIGARKSNYQPNIRYKIQQSHPKMHGNYKIHYYLIIVSNFVYRSYIISMELITYIENYTSIELPHFKHPIKNISSNTSATNNEQFYSSGISIPDKIIMNSRQNHEGEQNYMCYLLFGHQLKLSDWEHMLKLYPQFTYKVKLYRGNQVKQISENVLNAKSFIKGQKVINQPQKSLFKKNQKTQQPSTHMYTVEISPTDTSQQLKIVYYLPSVFNKSSGEYPLECIKSRYFNNKMLQILSEYVSLDNNSTSCYKDMAHHDFEAVVYTGKVSSFQVIIRLCNSKSDQEVSDSYVEKLSQISMTDKHLLDQVDPLDFSQIKREIRKMYLEEKRIRKSLTFQKIRIVEQIQNALQFLNLKQVYPNKLSFHSITSDMLKKIRSQNIQNKTSWVKQQKFIMSNLDARIIDLQKTKSRLQDTLLSQQKANNQEIQTIRNQIKYLQTSIRYEQAQKANKVFNDSIHNKEMRKNGTCTRVKTSQSAKKNAIDEIMMSKDELDDLEKQKILKYQMIKAEFQMEKQLMRRKSEYARASQQIFNYLIDC